MLSYEYNEQASREWKTSTSTEKENQNYIYPLTYIQSIVQNIIH